MVSTRSIRRRSDRASLCRLIQMGGGVGHPAYRAGGMGEVSPRDPISLNMGELTEECKPFGDTRLRFLPLILHNCWLIQDGHHPD